MDAARRDTSISGLRIYRLRFVLGALRSIIVPKPFRSTHAGTARVLRTVPVDLNLNLNLNFNLNLNLGPSLPKS